MLADSSGNVVKGIDDDPLGNIVGDTNPSFAVPSGFTGGLHDRETGVVRFGFRDYDPDVGGWSAKDPIGLRGGVDLYGYCFDDPVTWIDCFGLQQAHPLGPPPVPVPGGGGNMEMKSRPEKFQRGNLGS
jgi:RHS repeat-associated protein